MNHAHYYYCRYRHSLFNLHLWRSAIPATPRKPRNLIPCEDDEHLAFMEWVAYHPRILECLIHIPNGGSRHPAEAKKLKRMGVKAGVFDFFLAIPKASYHGAWFELKRVKKSVVSPAQLNWQKLTLEQGYYASISKGCLELIKEVKYYMALE